VFRFPTPGEFINFSISLTRMSVIPLAVSRLLGYNNYLSSKRITKCQFFFPEHPCC
jgi:hypothetical protein